MQALTADERAILKSRFQAGTSGHRQRVKLTAFDAPTDLHNPYHISSTLMPNGQAGLLMRGLVSPFTPGSEKIYFVGYSTEHAVQSTIELFSFSTPHFAIATYRPVGLSLKTIDDGFVVAIAWEAATTKIWMRTSRDNGASWTVAVQVPAATTFAQNTIDWNSLGRYSALTLRSNKVQDTLYIFFINNATKHVRYRKTTDTDPTTGWSADTDSGFTIPSVGRNYGGSFGGNQQDSRAYVICETITPGTWVIGAESDDGDWHANHAFFKGTLGGAWTRKLNGSFGGGLSGNQGSNGGLFLDGATGDIIGYMMSNEGMQMTWYRSTDSGETWSAGTDIFTLAGNVGNVGCGDGLYVEAWSAKLYVWGGEPGLAKTPEAANRLCVTKVNVLPTTGNIRAIIVLGGRSSTTIDVSDRVVVISTDKDSTLDADTVNIDFHNEDQAFDINNAAAAYWKYSQPNVLVEVWQWYGDVANALPTFYGSTDSFRQHDSPRTVTLTARGYGSKKLLVQDVRLIGPQDLKVEGYIRTTNNFVYLNKTVNQVLTHILTYAGIPLTKMDFVESTMKFNELRGDDLSTLMDLAKRACELAGLEMWEDETGVFHTRHFGQARPSSWTFRADEDITSLDPDIDDDSLKTRVRVMGKANIGAKYLAEIFKWSGPEAEGFATGVAALAYDKTTKGLWVLTQSGYLYLLDPKDPAEIGDSHMPILAGPYNTGLTYPDGISVDPLDNNLWLCDGFDGSTGFSASRVFKKVSRTDGTTVLLGPFTNPQGDHCSMWAWNDAGTIKLKMATYFGKRIYTMNSTTGATISFVDLNVVVDPGVEPNPTGLAPDTGGGEYLTGWESEEFYQILDGNMVNAIKQDSKNSNYISTVTDDAASDYGSVFVAFRDQPAQIIKYEPTAPDGVETATYAEVFDTALETQLGGEVRIAVITDLAISDKSLARRVGNRKLDQLHVYARHITQGGVGNPAIQKGDRVTVVSPSTGVMAGDETKDWVVTAIRADQHADDGSYLMVLVLIPYVQLLGTAV